jgi:hypothetical protein
MTAIAKAANNVSFTPFPLLAPRFQCCVQPCNSPCHLATKQSIDDYQQHHYRALSSEWKSEKDEIRKILGAGDIADAVGRSLFSSFSSRVVRSPRLLLLLR